MNLITAKTTDEQILAPVERAKRALLDSTAQALGEEIMRGEKLVELAQSVHLSTAYFSRLFRKTVGISPKQYLIRYRVERAKQLLMINPEHLPIKAIAAQSGFASPEQFTRTFHRMVGCAPHEFVS